MAYTDYHKASGDGLLKMRDYGNEIEFWVKAGYSNFYWENLSFSYTDADGTINTDIDYPQGADWKYVGHKYVSTTQTVTFRLLESTGTSSLAGPTTFSRVFNRDTVPSNPDPVTFSSVTPTSLVASFTDNGNGGDPIDTRQLAYRIGVNTGTLYSLTSDGSTAISGLTPGTKYFFFARVHNSVGWSGYSSVREVVTPNVPPAPGPVALSEVTQKSVRAIFSGNGDGGSPVTEWRIGYGLSPAGPTAYIVGYNLVIDNLSPGQTYYFWSQGKNVWGYGPLSIPTSQQLIAGAFIKVGLEWKRAVPYVKVAGVWKVARPWSRLQGAWRESIR